MRAKSASKPIIYLATGAVVLAGVAGYVWHESNRPKILEVYAFDLPGSPGILIRTPEDRRILINGGSNAEIIGHITKKLPFYSRRIDMVIITEADGKHVTGLVDVLKRYKVDQVLIPAMTLSSLGLSSTTDQIYETLLKTVHDLNVKTVEVAAGKRLSIEKELTLDVLFPTTTENFEYSKASAPEAVLRLNHGNNSILFAGNASTKVQKFIAANGLRPSDVLIISHSAAVGSLAREFMDELSPDYLVISKQMTKIAKAAKSTVAAKKKKTNGDPLASFLNDKRFNIRETGEIKIASDGNEVTIKNK